MLHHQPHLQKLHDLNRSGAYHDADSHGHVLDMEMLPLLPNTNIHPRMKRTTLLNIVFEVHVGRTVHACSMLMYVHVYLRNAH